jgi:hypothetical protein
LIATLKRGMDALPAELQALILTADFATWTAAVQTLGRITVQPYVQSYARQKFLRSHTNSIGVISYLLMDDMSTRHGKCKKTFTENKDLCRSSRSYHRGVQHGKFTRKYYRQDNLICVYTVWVRNGVLHRDDGPAYTVCIAGCMKQEKWIQGGVLHRSHVNGGPAVIDTSASGEITLKWYQHGKLHRPCIGPESGPAVIYPDGSMKWYLEGIKYVVYPI